MPETKSKKIRIDQLLVQRGLAPSRHRAQAMVLAGQVLVGEHRVDKSSQTFPSDAPLRLKGPDHPFVSRGGVKLADALDKLQINPEGKVCLDIGASTGGFTDCLLQRGAARIFAFDTGSHQLHERLRNDPRVILRENFNARYLRPEDLPEPIALVVADVSFISLKLILPPLLQSLSRPWEGIVLIKPQFEASPSLVGKGGVIRDPDLREKIVADLTEFAQGMGLMTRPAIPAAISGESGNQEYFLYLRPPG